MLRSHEDGCTIRQLIVVSASPRLFRGRRPSHKAPSFNQQPHTLQARLASLVMQGYLCVPWLWYLAGVKRANTNCVK